MRVSAAVAVLWVGFAVGANAQQARVCVVDLQGRPLPDARVVVANGGESPLNADACASVPAGSRVTVTLAGFASITLPSPTQGGTARVELRPSTAESVTVTADRGLAGINDAASSVAVLTPAEIEQQPGLTLDDALHQVAGFQLFRRTSSWTANPTSSGVSLRGLGSTAASRTLVVSDQVPMNDPFGGWVHWNEIPQTAIRDVELVRGGSAELYGSSAIGGVIDVAAVEPREPQALHLNAEASGATENTALLDATADSASRWIGALAAANDLHTGGYITTAPALRGAVDVPTNVNSQSGRVELRTPSVRGRRN